MKINQLLLPNKQNKFHPHILRPVGLMAVALVLMAIPSLYNVASAQPGKVLGYATSVTIGELYALSNQQRQNNGLANLSLNSQLNNAAANKANDMMAKNYWAHDAPDGTTPWAFITAAGYQYTSAGENLAKDFDQSSGVVAGWMASPGHRANILNTTYRDVGYAVLNGVLQGSETTLVVAMYGAQYTPPPPPPAPPVQQSVQAPPPPAQSQAQSQPVVTNSTEQTTAPSPTPASSAETSEPAPTTSPQAIIREASAPPATSTTTSSATTDGSVMGAAVALPAKVYQSLNWGKKASLFVISTLIVLLIMKHTLIWREQKRGVRHIWLRAHPIGQVSMLVVVFLATLASGVGVVL